VTKRREEERRGEERRARWRVGWFFIGREDEKKLEEEG
jgi:hypothetical protein